MTDTPDPADEALSTQDAADLTAMHDAANEAALAALKPPTDHRGKADDGSRILHAEQLVDKAIERAGNGLGVVSFIGTMFGQVGEFCESNGFDVDWAGVMLRTKRTDKAGVEAETHAIVPKGTLILVLDITVRPRR